MTGWNGVVHKGKSMCPASYCKADNPVQAMIGDREAERIGLIDLAGKIRCAPMRDGFDE